MCLLAKCQHNVGNNTTDNAKDNICISVTKALYCYSFVTDDLNQGL